MLGEQQYLDLLKDIMDNGIEKMDRTGVGTKVLSFPKELIFYMKDGIPLLTTKKVAWKNAIKELLWMISGSSNINDLPTETQHWWKPWANEDGSLGPVYGELWRKWPYGNDKIDQLQNVINSISDNPTSRRHIINTWHVGEINNQKLPPCHGLIIQFCVDTNLLSCKVYQRSADVFIGSTMNIFEYAVLLHMISQVCNLIPHKLVYSLGDAHIYNNHQMQVQEQLLRKPFNFPRLNINKEIKNINNFKLIDFNIENYTHHTAIKAPIAV